MCWAAAAGSAACSPRTAVCGTPAPGLSVHASPVPFAFWPSFAPSVVVPLAHASVPLGGSGAPEGYGKGKIF